MQKIAGVLFLVAVTLAGLGGCSSGGGGGAAFLPSSATATGAAISAKGGEGTGGYGGDGASYFYIATFEGNQIRIERTGSVDTAFNTKLADEFVSSASFSLGSVPCDILSNTTVKVYDMTISTPTTTGEYFLVSAAATGYDNQTMYRWNGTSGDAVTGIYVHAGATVTLGLNQNQGGNSGFDTVYVHVVNDMRNDGVITTMSLAAGATPVNVTPALTPDGLNRDMASLYLLTDGTWLNNGSILLKGRDAAAGNNGGSGGLFYGWANTIVFSRGEVNTSGGSGDNGGVAGNASWNSNYGVWNSGGMFARGGAGQNGVGGKGGWIKLVAQNYPGPVYNSASLDMSGGDGAFVGGDAGQLDLSTGQSNSFAGGDVVNSGAITGSGGNATSVGGSGGIGSPAAQMQANGGNIRNSGAVQIRGGNGKGTGSMGGQGGFLNVWTNWAYDPHYNNQTAAGSILFSGAIAADGGSGEIGGSAGGVQFYQKGAPATGDIVLAGYGTINLTGGRGATNGGIGGYADIEVYSGDQFAMATILNQADIDTSGGYGAATYGGDGGYVYIDADYSNFSNPAESFMLDNSGNITSSGGNGFANGGVAGTIELFSSQNIRNTGQLKARGGDASDASGGGGDGTYVDVWAIGSIFNYGQIITSGGYGPSYGGNGDWMELWSEYGLTINTASIFANGGGSSAATGSGGNAYSAGYAIDLRSSNSGGPYRTQNSGTLQANGGSGSVPGAAGTRAIDGVQL